jgi:hypothetical protein
MAGATLSSSSRCVRALALADALLSWCRDRLQTRFQGCNVGMPPRPAAQSILHHHGASSNRKCLQEHMEGSITLLASLGTVLLDASHQMDVQLLLAA